MTAVRIPSPLLVLAAIVVSMAVAGAAQAAPLSSGRALVRLDTPKGVVTQQADGSYQMVLAKGAKGQWMGARTDAAGNTRTRVGSLTAGQLAAHWGDLRYTKSGVYAGLVWNQTSTGADHALVHLSQPRTTAKGIVFAFTAPEAIPNAIGAASLNLRRAPKARASARETFPVTGTFNIADDLWVSAEATDANTVKMRIYNATNDNTCWGTTTLSGGNGVYSANSPVKSNTCDNIPYVGWNTNYGAEAQFPEPGVDQADAWINLKVTPPNEASYQLYQEIASWS